MARAHFVTYALDSEGRPIAGCTVTVREPDTETAIAETIYAEDDPDVTTKTNPFTADADGKVEIWLENPKIVDLFITKTGFDPSTIRATAHQLTASTLTLKEAGTPLAQRAGINFQSGFDLTDDAANDETEIAIDLTEVTTFTDHSARHENGGADEISLAGLDGTPTDLQTHLDDAADAHDASAISIADSGGDFTATDVEGALAELQSDHETDSAALTSHEADTTSIHGIADTSALETTSGAQTKVDTHVNDAADAHDASAISIADSGGDFTATDVEGALAELQADHESDAADLATHEAGSVRIRKASDEAVTSSTTLQNDNDFTFVLGAGEHWEFELLIRYRANTAGDLKFDVAGPAAEGMVHRYPVGASSTTDTLTEYSADLSVAVSAGGLGTGTEAVVHVRGTAHGGALGEVFVFRFAQDTSNAAATTVKAESFLVAHRID